MRISRLQVYGYRSIKSIDLKLDALNVIAGANGTGKSNLYRSLYILWAAASGQLAQVLAQEGGMTSALWAGKRSKLDDAVFRIQVKLDDLTYKFECGCVPASARGFMSYPGWFSNDPDIKKEEVTTDFRARKIHLLKRKRGAISARNMDGRPIEYPLTGSGCESVLSCLREPHLFPDLSVLRQEILGWRFYHHFRTDLASPLRREQIPVFTPVLSHDGHDLASALASIMAAEGEVNLKKHLNNAFPGAELSIDMEPRTVAFTLQMPGLNRPFNARELSDGTLQYLCLLAALLTERPPNLLVLNEPETSMHPDLYGPLAELLVDASKRCQIVITTHARELAATIEKLSGNKTIHLEKDDGATSIVGARPFDFYDDDEDDED